MSQPNQYAKPFAIPTNLDSLMKNKGVLTGSLPDGRRHAIAWANNDFIDPGNTGLKAISDFQVDTFYIIKSRFQF